MTLRRAHLSQARILLIIRGEKRASGGWAWPVNGRSLSSGAQGLTFAASLSMLLIAKTIARFLQQRPRFTLAFWIVSNAFLLILCISVELIDDAERRLNLSLNETSWEADLLKDLSGRPAISAVFPAVVLPALVLSILTRSLPVVLASSLASLQTSCLLTIASRFDVFREASTTMFILTSSLVSTANAIAVRKSWEKSRRGPSESTIGRLLVSCVDKSLPICIVLTTTASLLPLLAAPLDPLHSLTSSVILATCSLLQNLCAQMTVLAVLLVRHDFNLSCPTAPRGCGRLLQALVDEKLVYFAHFVCQIGQRMLASSLKIPLLVLYALALLVYMTKLGLRTFLTMYSASKRGQEDWRTLAAISGAFSMTLLLLVAINRRVQMHTAASIAAVSASFSTFHFFEELLLPKVDLSLLQILTVSIIPIDSSVRYCLAYKCSRKKKHSSKVLDALDTVFSQITIPAVAMISTAALFYFRDQELMMAPLVATLVVTWFSSVIFTSAAMMFFGAWSSCGRHRRESQQSDSRSLYTEKLSSHPIFLTLKTTPDATVLLIIMPTAE
ncbi:unnamed protein product [Caenorhabditis auriculariae]|uniref:Uncharacterized protein n=1 Tax=Caenorhabditis auriculariae TaxID=2777116 RepID=A0A8S1HDI1_9PELO|nr:unnamed protein product [Caenorhabditis auriculariae]